MNTPKPCTEDQFIDAQIISPPIGWTRAGNGESFKVVTATSITVYARTGKHYWMFTTEEPMNHASIMAAIYAVIAEERSDPVEPTKEKVK